MVRICRIRQLKVYDWSTGSVFGKVGTRRLPGRRNENAPSPHSFVYFEMFDC
jgi:hypothetical protein